MIGEKEIRTNDDGIGVDRRHSCHELEKTSGFSSTLANPDTTYSIPTMPRIQIVPITRIVLNL